MQKAQNGVFIMMNTTYYKVAYDFKGGNGDGLKFFLEIKHNGNLPEILNKMLVAYQNYLIDIKDNEIYEGACDDYGCFNDWTYYDLQNEYKEKCYLQECREVDKKEVDKTCCYLEKDFEEKFEF